MNKKILAALASIIISTQTHAMTDPVDCNKASSMASAAVFSLSQGVSMSSVLDKLPEASHKANLNEAELIVATGIVANVYSQGVANVYEQLNITKADADKKRVTTKNVFYMFCQNAFKYKNYY